MIFQPISASEGQASSRVCRSNLWLLLAVVSALGFAIQTANAEASAQTQTIETGFYPFGGGEELAVKAIAAAKQSIFVAAEGLASGSVVQALIEAHKHGVNILVVLDKSQEKARNSAAKLLAHEGILVRFDHKHASMNNNYMLIDGQTLEIGRFNYTQESAKKSADSVLVEWNNPALAKAYRNNWQEHWDHSALSR